MSDLPAIIRAHESKAWDQAHEAVMEKLSGYVRDDGLIDQHIVIIGISRMVNPYKEQQ